jgi:hypothetical protein
VNRPVSARAFGSPGGPAFTFYLGYVLARVCESLARWSHGEAESVATVCPYAITVVLRADGA